MQALIIQVDIYYLLNTILLSKNRNLTAFIISEKYLMYIFFDHAVGQHKLYTEKIMTTL